MEKTVLLRARLGGDVNNLKKPERICENHKFDFDEYGCLITAKGEYAWFDSIDVMVDMLLDDGFEPVTIADLELEEFIYNPNIPAGIQTVVIPAVIYNDSTEMLTNP